MRRKVWRLLKKKDVSDKLDYAVKSAWYKFAPVDGVFKFASAFWNLDPKVSDRFEIIDSNTESDKYAELAEKRVSDRRHVETYSIKRYWLNSHSETTYTKFPLNFQIRNYHTSSKKWKKEDVTVDSEDGLDTPKEPEKPKAFKFTIGSSDFRELRFGDDYVDKTEFIAAFENSGYKVCVNTFPRRFQKSTNLSTIEHFYDIEVDETGEPLPFEERKNTVLFTGGESLGIDGTSRLLDPLKVSAYPDIMRLQGTIPVISADFQGVSGNSYEKSLTKVKQFIHSAAAKHTYLASSDRVNWDSLKYKFKFQRFIKFLESGDILEDELPYIMSDLCEFLHAHFGINPNYA